MKFMYAGLVWSLMVGASIAEADEESEYEGISDYLNKVDEFRRELHEWDRSVRGFRTGHNFFGAFGFAYGTWQINGSLTRPEGPYSYDRRIETSADVWSAQYSFHLPISGGFGYYLGSSAGVILNEDSKTKDLVIDRTLNLPGISLGLIYNFSPAFRFFGGLDWQLVRYERFSERYRDYDANNIVTFFNAYATRAQVGADFFFRLRWALRLQWEKARIENLKVTGSTGQELGIFRQKIQNSYVGGFVYHII